MKSIRAALLGLAFMAALAPGVARAFSLSGAEGLFRPGDWMGEAGTGYEWEDQQSTMPTGPSIDLNRQRFDEFFNLRNDGFYLVDPRLIQGNAGVNLDGFQEIDRYTGLSRNMDGLLWGYAFSTTLLGEKPYPITLFTNRQQNQISTQYAGRTDTTTQNYGFAARLLESSIVSRMLPYFSSSIDAREDYTNTETKQLGQTYSLRETQDLANYRLDKGFETADLAFTYSFVNDRTAGTNRLHFQTQSANLNYNRDFGPLLNRRWDSRVNFFSRSGNFSQTFLWADEMLRWQHYRNLSTLYHYILTYSSTPGQTSTTHNGLFTIQHRLYENVDTALTLNGLYQSLSQGYTYSYGGDLSPSYSHTLPWWNGLLSFGGDFGYQISGQHIPSGAIQVIDEQHAAPPPNVGFNLANPFVVQSSILVLDNRGGGRIPTVLGVDYAVATLGELTQIVILPGSLIIQTGDPLLVSYTYQVAPDQQFSTTIWMLDAGLHFTLIDFFWIHQVIDEHLLKGGGAQFLNNTTEDQLRLDLHKDWEKIEARTSFLYQNYDSTFLSYILYDANQSVFVRPGWDLVLGGIADEILTDYSFPKRRTATKSFELSLDRLIADADFEAYFRVRNIDDSLFPSELDLEAGIQGRFRYGKFEVVPMFRWINHKWGNLQINDPRFQIRIMRFL